VCSSDLFVFVSVFEDVFREEEKVSHRWVDW
jgi:hypothetical protein